MTPDSNVQLNENFIRYRIYFQNGKQDFELFRKQFCCYFNVCKFLRNLFSSQITNTICKTGLSSARKKKDRKKKT